MTKPIPDKAEVALEYPDKLYIGTFERTARFDAHLDETGISLSLYRTGAVDVRKTIRMHFHYALFAEILRDLAKTVSRPASAHGSVAMATNSVNSGAAFGVVHCRGGSGMSVSGAKDATATAISAALMKPAARNGSDPAFRESRA